MKKYILAVMLLVAVVSGRAEAQVVATQCDSSGTYITFVNGYVFSKPANLVRGLLNILTEPLIIAAWRAEIDNYEHTAINVNNILFDIENVSGGCSSLEIING